MTDKEGKFYYLIVSIILALIFEPFVGLTVVVWLGVLGWIIKDDENMWLALLWYWFGVVPSVFIAMFIADLFK